MGELFKHIIDFIKDRTTSWGFKTALFISIVSFIFISDYYLGFSYNYHLNNKISQLEKINNLKLNYRTDSLTLSKLSEMEKKVLMKKHYSERLSFLFIKDSISSTTSEIITDKSEIKDQNVNQSTTETTTTIKPIKSLFWMAFSSNFLLVLVLPFLFFLPLYNVENRNARGVLEWFASLITIAIIGTLVTWISYQIPLIWNNPIWNYILNFLIHTLFWILIIKLGNDKNRKTYANNI